MESRDWISETSGTCEAERQTQIEGYGSGILDNYLAITPFWILGFGGSWFNLHNPLEQFMASSRSAELRLPAAHGDVILDAALNAVRATGSLTPPPASVRADFEDIELVFRAGDLMQP